MNERYDILEFRCLNASEYFTFVRYRVSEYSFTDYISVHIGTNSAVEKFDFVTAWLSFML